MAKARAAEPKPKPKPKPPLQQEEAKAKALGREAKAHLEQDVLIEPLTAKVSATTTMTRTTSALKAGHAGSFTYAADALEITLCLHATGTPAELRLKALEQAASDVAQVRWILPHLWGKMLLGKVHCRSLLLKLTLLHW